MQDSYRPKPGDRIFRPRRIKLPHLRRVLGVPALFSAGYGDVGSSIYYGLGVVALFALGATPIVLMIAGIIYIFNALTYAEGSAMIPEAGGSASFARHGFNDMAGFISGWALMLSYIVTMAISAYTIPPYLSYFWPILNEPVIGTMVSMGIIAFLMLINVLGVRDSSRVNIFFISIDIATQITLVVLGIVLIVAVNPGVLFHNMFGAGNWPSTQNLIFGIAIAALCFTGVETVSQLAEETRAPAKKIPQAYVLMIVAVMVLFAGISIVALSAMTPQVLGDPVNGWARDPIAGIAANLPSDILQDIFAPLVAVLAASILLTATNAGLMGISRLSYNLSSHHQLPAALSRVHHRFRTPYIAIILFCLISLLVLTPGFFSANFFADLGALYVFGSLLCFALAHASILALRMRKPDLERPFKLRWNIKTKGKELPMTAILGLIATSVIWIIVIITQPYSRGVGFGWLAVGLIIYCIYRWKSRLPLTHLPKKPGEKGIVDSTTEDYNTKHPL
ncbi:MAG: APC family permease [Dehalococcoidales bacterium]|nr:APC family permease [Dehalococcoidales bacterium]